MVAVGHRLVDKFVCWAFLLTFVLYAGGSIGMWISSWPPSSSAGKLVDGKLACKLGLKVASSGGTTLANRMNLSAVSGFQQTGEDE